MMYALMAFWTLVFDTAFAVGRDEEPFELTHTKTCICGSCPCSLPAPVAQFVAQVAP